MRHRTIGHQGVVHNLKLWLVPTHFPIREVLPVEERFPAGPKAFQNLSFPFVTATAAFVKPTSWTPVIPPVHELHEIHISICREFDQQAKARLDRLPPKDSRKTDFDALHVLICHKRTGPCYFKFRRLAEVGERFSGARESEA